jgi:hypothetical protein
MRLNTGNPSFQCRAFIAQLQKAFVLSPLPGDLFEVKFPPRFLTLPQLSAFLPLMTLPSCFLKQAAKGLHETN